MQNRVQIMEKECLNGNRTNILSWRLKVWCKEKVFNEEGVEQPKVIQF